MQWVVLNNKVLTSSQSKIDNYHQSVFGRVSLISLALVSGVSIFFSMYFFISVFYLIKSLVSLKPPTNSPATKTIGYLVSPQNSGSLNLYSYPSAFKSRFIDRTWTPLSDKSFLASAHSLHLLTVNIIALLVLICLSMSKNLGANVFLTIHSRWTD